MVYALHLPAPQSPEGDRAALTFLLDRLPPPAERDRDDAHATTLEALHRRFPNL